MKSLFLYLSRLWISSRHSFNSCTVASNEEVRLKRHNFLQHCAFDKASWATSVKSSGMMPSSKVWQPFDDERRTVAASLALIWWRRLTPSDIGSRRSEAPQATRKDDSTLGFLNNGDCFAGLTMMAETNSPGYWISQVGGTSSDEERRQHARVPE